VSRQANYQAELRKAGEKLAYYTRRHHARCSYRSLEVTITYNNSSQCNYTQMKLALER